MRKFWYGLAAATVVTFPAWAEGVANTDIVGIADDGVATFTSILVKVLGVCGIIMAVTIGKRVWNRFSK